jgi:hypothetical protein
VTLAPGPIRDALDRNAHYLTHCHSSHTMCDGIGWSEWLPASNDGRMLAGAANMLRWEERSDLRSIVNALDDAIAARMRPDGYYGYYPEEDSYALTSGVNSERKNYDRVFWTRGLLAASEVGAPKAAKTLRAMYDWFNSSTHLPNMLMGGNATNGLPGGPLVHLSPIGRPDDLITTQRFYDQDYWFRALADAEPLAFSHYPGERPHCYALLGLEAIVDEYRATGEQKYLDAALGGWRAYRDNFKHTGGATAIMESHTLCPPRSYLLSTTLIGETCGSIFWMEINSKLLQLFPETETYAAEIEEAIFNIVLSAQDERGYIRYHNVLEGTKRDAGCKNTCCEVSSIGMIARLPEFIFSVASDGIFVNQFIAGSIDAEIGSGRVCVDLTTQFPETGETTLLITIHEPIEFALRIRIPAWCEAGVEIWLGGEVVARGVPGTYSTITRVWHADDRLTFRLPMPWRTVQYEGLEQAEGNLGRYALFRGPILMGLTGYEGDGTPRVNIDPGELPSRLAASEDPSSFDVAGHAGLRYLPYSRISNERFNCFPIVEA